MKQNLIRCAAFALVLVFALGLFSWAAPSASAATYAGNFVYTPQPELGVQLINNLCTAISQYFGWQWSPDDVMSFTWSAMGQVSMDTLQAQRDLYSRRYDTVDWLGNQAGLTAAQRNALNHFSRGEIRSDEYADCTVYRIYDVRTGKIAVDSQGRYPYVKVVKTGDVPVTNSTPSNKSGNTWRSISNLPKTKVVLDKTVLDNLNAELIMSGVSSQLYTANDFIYIRKTDSTSGGFLVYCDSQGRPFVASSKPAAADQTLNYITNEGDKVTNDNRTIVETQIIDKSTTNNVDNSTTIGTLNVINDSSDHSTTNNITEYNIESLIYDDSTHSYVANTYQVEYDATNNYYEYKYYTYNIQYNITNTYVTYIGSNDAYEQEEYRYYYELPDGRSSADLTADEIAGMSFQFADCVNYARSATDTSLRALYHFDGNTDDSGYFGTQTAFTWTQGASITYMDSSAFNGALYLDETAHKFTVTLPSALGSGDFTIQWRYYQASQADTVDNKENSFSIGTTKLFTWDERSYYFGSSTACSPVGIGTWNEVALVRHSTMLYLYVNGLKVAEKSVNTPYGNEFTFTFGSTSRAYSMLDELRVVNFAVAENGTSYTPTDVPYDTNLVLVLPDSAFPIADEYYEYHLPENALTASPFNLGKVPDGMSYSSSGTNAVKVSFFDDYTTISAGSSSMSYLDGGGLKVYGTGVLRRYVYDDGDPDYVSGSCLSAGDYTFTVVTLDGKVYSLPVTLLRSSQTFVTSTSYDYYYFNRLATGSGVKVSGSSRYKYLDCGNFYMAVYSCDSLPTSTALIDSYATVSFRIIPKAGNYLDLIYASIIPGSAPDDAVEKVSCIYSSEEVKPNTAAIQSDIPVKGYTVGGVRPTFPQRGDVWMSVNGSRISGVQIYNGRAWESTNARYYTGTRWIPIYAFDIQTLEDCWDIADGDDAVPPISTEEGFWSWWQHQWLDFRKWLESSPGGIVVGPGGDLEPGSPGSGQSWWNKILDSITGALAEIVNMVFDLITKILGLVMDLVYDLLGFFFDLLSTTVINGIGGLFDAIMDGSFLEFFQQKQIVTDSEGNETEVTVLGLPAGIAQVFAVMSGIIMALPGDVRSVLFFGFAAFALIIIFKMVRS